ncbi:hypothetical protein [Rhodococcus olei]|uniref:hypothetical protein n=1 Tax=Rhodococcus olei TaxID=2161675 RepID=UPI0031EEB198
MTADRSLCLPGQVRGSPAVSARHAEFVARPRPHPAPTLTATADLFPDLTVDVTQTFGFTGLGHLNRKGAVALCLRSDDGDLHLVGSSPEDKG